MTPKLLSAETIALYQQGCEVDIEGTRVNVSCDDVSLLLNHIAALEADNAALLEALGDISTRCETKELRQYSPDDANLAGKQQRVIDGVWDVARKACSEPHPGAAMLEEHSKEIERWQENVETLRGERDSERNLRAERDAALEALRAFVEGFCLTAEGAVRHQETKGQGGQQVGYHDHFASIPPSVTGHLRWWAREARHALDGKTAGLLVRARNEGREEARREIARARAKAPPGSMAHSLLLLADEATLASKESEQ